MIPLVFAAALNVSSPDVVTPNRRNVVTLTGSAVLANTKPGSYRVSAHFPVSLERSEVVGDPIPSVRVSPPLLRLKEGKSRRFVAHIPVTSGYSGPLYLCITFIDAKRLFSVLNLEFFDRCVRYNAIIFGLVGKLCKLCFEQNNAKSL